MVCVLICRGNESIHIENIYFYEHISNMYSIIRGVFPLELCIMLATFTAVTSVQFTDKYHNNNKSTKCKIFIHKEWSNIEGSEHKINTDVH